MPTPIVSETTPAPAKKGRKHPKKMKGNRKWTYGSSPTRGVQNDGKGGAQSPRPPSTKRAASKVVRSRVKKASALPEEKTLSEKEM